VQNAQVPEIPVLKNPLLEIILFTCSKRFNHDIPAKQSLVHLARQIRTVTGICILK